MKTLIRAFLMLAIIFILSGCRQEKMDDRGVRKESQKQDIEQAKSIDLVNMIHRPESYLFSLERDPFRPFFDKAYLPAIGMGLFEPRDLEINVHGIMLKGGDAIALLKTPAGVFFVREGGRVGGYTVINIGLETVTIEDEDKTKVLKLGGEDENK